MTLDTIGRSLPQVEDEIKIRFCFVDGDTYTQRIRIDQANVVEDLLKWYRSSKGSPTWTWAFSGLQNITLLSRCHIMVIEIDGYIELARVSQKWHEKLHDKFLTALIFFRIHKK